MGHAGTESDSHGRQWLSRQIRHRARVAVVALAVLLISAIVMPSTARAAREPSAASATAPVIGGYKSTYGPWAVRMLVDGKAHCTGTAITDQWILSASHCFFDQPDQPVKDKRITFRVGNLDQRKGTLVHPVSGSRVQSPSGADMMLIRVPKMKIPTAVLDTHKVKPGQKVRVFGWDATCTGDENSCESNVLRQADLKVLSYKDERCFGYGTADGSDFCSTVVRGVPTGGDSGAPVMTSAAKGKEQLVGVMWGSDRTSMVGTGSIYHQLKWLRKVTGVK